MKKILRNILIVLILLLPCAEIAARIVGWRPYTNQDYSIISEPSAWLKGDTSMGMHLVPGDFQVTLNHGLTFTTTHKEDGMRRTGKVEYTGQEVHVFGCSFTYGYGVNDAYTFSWLVQEKFPDYNLRNHAVPGYGTVQALLQLKAMIAEGNIPHCVVLVHSKVHPERDVMALSYRKALKIGFVRAGEKTRIAMRQASFPYMEAGKVKHCQWEALYDNWAGRETFAIVNALQSSFEYNIPEEEQRKVTADLFEEFMDLCEKNAIRVALVNLDDPNFKQHYPALVKREGLKVISVGFDFSNQALTNYPYDSHPNAKGHAFIAEKLNRALRSLLND